MPLVNSASGRVFASYLPESVIRPLMQEEWDKAAALGLALKPANWDEFNQLKQQICTEQMALAKGDLLVGINAVGLPVFNAQGQIEFSVVAIDSETFLPLHIGSEKVQLLQQEVAAINRFIQAR
jgi:DNA-binding IclR family transcriptional regulator